MCEKQNFLCVLSLFKPITIKNPQPIVENNPTKKIKTGEKKETIKTLKAIQARMKKNLVQPLNAFPLFVFIVSKLIIKNI